MSDDTLEEELIEALHGFEDQLERVESCVERREERQFRQRKLDRIAEQQEALAERLTEQHRMVRLLARAKGVAVPEPPSQNGHTRSHDRIMNPDTTAKTTEEHQ